VYNYSYQNPINYIDPDGSIAKSPKLTKGSNNFVKIAAHVFEGYSQGFSFDNQTNRNFWSGGPTAMNAAHSHATAQNRIKGITDKTDKNATITLEDTEVGGFLETLTGNTGFDRTEGLWGLVSKKFASGATGNTNLFKGENLREGNILENQEEPIIKRVNRNNVKSNRINNKGNVIKTEKVKQNF